MRNEELELGSKIIVGFIDDAIGVVELEIVANEIVEEMDLKEFTVLKGSVTTVLPCLRSFLLSVMISVVPLESSSISVLIFETMS